MVTVHCIILPNLFSEQYLIGWLGLILIFFVSNRMDLRGASDDDYDFANDDDSSYP
jgi:hypothetical protein